MAPDHAVERSAPDVAENVEESADATSDERRNVGLGLSRMFAGRRAGSSSARPEPVRPAANVRTLVPMLHDVQRLAGNQAAIAIVERVRGGEVVQRDPDEGDEAPAADVSVTAITLTPELVTTPTTTSPQATAAPADATGVVYSLEAGSVEPTNVAIDSSTGAITVADGQQGGTVKVWATASDDSAQWRALRIVERPGAVSATDPSGSANYGGQFTHTFSAPSGHSSGLEGANINEQFASHSATPPWVTPFALTANAAGSHGWDLDSGGRMTGPDNVDISAAGIDVGKLVHSASNPNPTVALPAGFTMTQSLRSTVQPGGAVEADAFTTIDHTREFITGYQFKVTAGLDSIIEDYSGPAAVTNAAASSTTVMASPPRPATGTWEQRKVTVTADAIPDTATLTYSITGRALGCTVDSAGEVSIGATAGTITVRVTASRRNFDEVTITITPYVAPTSTESAPGATSPPASDAPNDAPDAPVEPAG